MRFRLDTQPNVAAPRAPVATTRPKTPRSAPGLLARGRAALAEYDFDAARAAFTEGLEAGVDGAGEALLELLVEHLAAYDEALALEPQLDSTPTLRAQLATAAARSGRAAECLRHAEGLVAPALGPAFIELARTALVSATVDEVAALLARARALDPTLPDLVPLSAELERARARARQPAEAELERLVSTGDEAAAAAHARALLARWPDSVFARRTLNQLEERSRGRAIAQALADADAAEARGDEAAAISILGRAVELGAAGLEARIAAARARLDARRAADAAAAVRARLASGLDAGSCRRPTWEKSRGRGGISST